MGMELLATILGVEATETALDALSPSVAVRALREAGEELSQRVREQFLSGGAAFGQGWRPLETQPQRHPTLIVTGALMESFRVLAQDETSITFGSDLWYAPFSEFGTKHEPQRQVLTPELLGGLLVET